MYVINGYTAEYGGVFHGAPLSDKEWSADALAGSGVR
jgi:hypothetical protein